MGKNSYAAGALPATGYAAYTRRKVWLLVCLAVLVFAAALLSLCVGSSGISPAKALSALFGFGSPESLLIVRTLRAPRVLAGLLCGAGLAVIGCVMQGVLKNPLADASTLGVSQGAAFGAAFAIIVCGAGTSAAAGFPALVTVCAFVGALAATAAILLISKAHPISPATMVLAGVALSAMFTGGQTLLQYFAQDVKVAAVVFWTFGDLGRVSYPELLIIAGVTFAAFIYFYLNRWNYNALQSGSDSARSLGVNVGRTRLLGMAICSLCAATIVSFVGVISFIGLIAPHAVRRFTGGDYRFLLPASALAGSLLVLTSDLAARLIAAPIILPIGALTSFVGAPVFLFILCKRGRKNGL